MGKIIEQPANISIAKMCLVYPMEAPRLSVPVMLKELPLAVYAMEHWIKHVLTASRDSLITAAAAGGVPSTKAGSTPPRSSLVYAAVTAAAYSFTNSCSRESLSSHRFHG
jgi:hypothetical protein